MADPSDRTTSVRARLAPLVEVLQVEVDLDLLDLATTHRSYAYEAGGLPHNERLEFLGDAVLGMCVTDTIFRQYPHLAEGQLAKLRAAVVNSNALADVARTLGLGDVLLLGRGEEITGGRRKASILADSMEAVIGAVYLSRGGQAEADVLIHRLFDPLIAASSQLGAALDWKTSLQEATARAGLGLPLYTAEASGPDHAKSFTAQVLVDGVVLGEGHGRTKKVAEQLAAETAYLTLTAAQSDPSAGPRADG